MVDAVFVPMHAPEVAAVTHDGAEAFMSVLARTALEDFVDANRDQAAIVWGAAMAREPAMLGALNRLDAAARRSIFRDGD